MSGANNSPSPSDKFRVLTYANSKLNYGQEEFILAKSLRDFSIFKQKEISKVSNSTPLKKEFKR